MYRAVTKRLGKPDYARVIQWIRLIGATGFTQGLVQLISLVCGIMVIRILPPSEYALYTLANTMLGTMIVLADGGIANAVMSQGGKVWLDRKKLGSVIVTGLRLRKIFAVISFPIAAAILFYLLQLHGASWLTAILIIISIVPIFFMMLRAGILEISPKLRQDIVRLQHVKVVSALGRLMILTSIFISPLAITALFSASLPQIWANTRYNKIASRFADLRQKTNPAVQKDVLKMIVRLLPEAIYYCLSAQIAVWLISVFGSTDAVAQIGALGRITIVLGFFSILFGNLIAPRFARLPNDRHILLTRYFQIQICLILLSIGIVTCVWQFSSQILWILGPYYYHLKTELVLMTIAGCLSLLYGGSFLLGTYRTWVIHPLLFISLSLITTIGCIIYLNISSLQSMITLNIVVSTVEVLMLIVFTTHKILKVETSHD